MLLSVNELSGIGPSKILLKNEFKYINEKEKRKRKKEKKKERKASQSY